jgi:selenocysteine-specific elongation factor
MREGLSREELKQRVSAELDPKIHARLVQTLVERNKAELEKDLLRLPGRGRILTVSEEGSRVKLLAALAKAGLSPPRVDELAQALSLPQPKLLELLKVCAAERALVKVSDALYFDRQAVEGLKERLVAHLQASNEITTQAFKELVGQSRKFVIPLSEYFDREKVTLRVGEKRVLRRG